MAMSPAIFKDIGRRRISDSWILLPIVCNSCDYSERLDTRKLRERQLEDGGGLSLAILATYIRNGEILLHGSTQGRCFDGNVFEFLEKGMEWKSAALYGSFGR